jgi:hypothetical protein
MVGAGDFNGTGEGGILWRNPSTGGVELWNSNGSGGFTYDALNPVNTNWQVAGTGDFNGAGADGILWRNPSTGGVELWNSNGSGGFTYESSEMRQQSSMVAPSGGSLMTSGRPCRGAAGSATLGSRATTAPELIKGRTNFRTGAVTRLRF